MKQKEKALICITFLCIMLGFAVGIQMKSVKKQSDPINVMRANELVAELKEKEQENENLTEQNQLLNQKVEEYEATISDLHGLPKILQQEIDAIKKFAGLKELQGPGLIINLNDRKKIDNGSVDPNLYLIHSEDMLTILNELFASGAEAVSINKQRLVANSSVRCSGPVVIVDGIKIAAPFEILAIGDPDVLDSALKISGGVVDYFKAWGLDIAIKKSQNIHIEKFKGSTEQHFAVPVEKENK